MSPELDKVSLHHYRSIPGSHALGRSKSRYFQTFYHNLSDNPCVTTPPLQVYSQFLANQVPAEWRRRGFASLKPLGSWMKDLRWRVRFFELWLERGNPYAFSLPAFFFPQVLNNLVIKTTEIFEHPIWKVPPEISRPRYLYHSFCRAPQGFLTAVLQNHARKHAVPVNLLGFKYDFPDIMQPEVRPRGGEYSLCVGDLPLGW